tara:strand:+ start:816 stop:1013 length:198 start_codon:yes stop_codon:yes gene_type:complete
MNKKIVVALVILVAFASCTQPEKTGFINNSELINEYQGKKILKININSETKCLKEKAIVSGKLIK